MDVASKFICGSGFEQSILGGAHFPVPEEEGRWEDEIGGEEAGEAEVRI